MTPHQTKNRLFALCAAGLPLLPGTYIYLAWRPDLIYLNRFLHNHLPVGLVSWIQSVSAFITLPAWLIQSLPDGLWMLSVVMMILTIWDFRLDRRSIPWLFMAMLCGFGYEFAQGLHWIYGTFDPLDLLIMLIGAILPLTLIPLKSSLCKT